MASDVRIGILGPLEVRVAFGEPVALVGPRLRALVIRLALDPDRVVLASQLIDAVWGTAPPAQAANALQSLVSRLRRLVPGMVSSHPAGYRLALEPEAVDADRFETLAAAGREELRRDPWQAARTLREALALWRGPALADVATADFAVPAIARLEALHLGALEDRVEADLGSGAGEALVAELDELVTAHPHQERLAGQLMRALARTGRQADALAAYERLRSRLADDLGIDPSEELQALHLGILRGETFPPAPGDLTALAEPPLEPAAEGPAPGRTNLRAQITSFVGRDDDITRISSTVADARLVTLIGPGGAGKTRLAGEAAVRLADRMPDGVWLVEFGSVVDPVDLPQAVLSLFGAREVGLLAPRGTVALPPEERLAEAVGTKRLLLVMDNCEHLVAAVAALVERLLGRCPGLRVLATSREPLGITGEALHPVGPLNFPDGTVTPSEALRYPAVRLLADRGAAARPGFEIDSATVGPVLRICRALDGMPLAIELAAARFRALTPEQVAARLDDRFRLLGGVSHTAQPRHQTLRAVVDWSWDLLGGAERVLLRRFSVFAGGATLEAAERVCAAPDLDGLAPDEVLYLLAALVDKSLLIAGEEGGAGEVRYSMLETVRAYGAERRIQADEERAVRSAHAGYFVALAEQADPRLRSRDQLVWIDRLTAERDNLSTALRWAVDGRDAVLAQRLVAALGWFWFLRSARIEATEWADQALALPGATPPELRAKVLAIRAFLAISGGWDMAGSVAYFNEALGLIEGLAPDDPRRLHPLLAVIPTLAALFHHDEGVALDRARELGDHPDPWIRALGHSVAGAVLENLGEAGAADAELQAGLAGFRELGERWGLGNVLVARAERSGTRGDHAAATAALEEAMEIFAGLGDREDIGQIMIRLALERARVGQFEQARAGLAAAARVADEVGADDQKFFIRHTLADVARWQGRLDEARELLDAAIARFQGSNFPVWQRHAALLVSRARVELAAGDLERAKEWAGQALDRAVTSRDRPVMGRAVELRAELALGDGDAEHAAELLGMAEVLRGMPDESDVDLRRVRAATPAALGAPGFVLAYQRGTARPRDELVAALAAEVSSTSAGTLAAPAERTPPR